ncbi:zinc ribbon domain-containing protein [Amycolatopsis mongoliensis]|uniref:zinc ribbon domain-containing protein n=1 Tax=Amycolatopsis mongoliensis TaxID=715475 RepID=UPI0038CC1953
MVPGSASATIRSRFTQVQLLRRAKTLAGRSRAERHGRRTRHKYLFQGLIRCATCDRKMEGSTTGPPHYYRCVPRNPSKPATHLHSISVREDHVYRTVSTWLAELDAARSPHDAESDHIAGAPSPGLAGTCRDLQLVVAVRSLQRDLGDVPPAARRRPTAAQHRPLADGRGCVELLNSR